MRFGQYYVDAQLKGEPGRLPIVDLPAGTLLFKATQIIDPRSMFFDFIGRVSAEGFCQTPYQNVFTFPHPYVGFGLFHKDVSNPAWNKFNAFQVYVLNANHSFVNMIKPSPMMRGHPHDYDKEGDSIKRCDTFGPLCKPSNLTEDEWNMFLNYDNCINSDFARKKGIMGSISIADNDSIFRKMHKKFNVNESSMGQYLRSLYAKNKELAAHLIMNTYIDARYLRGIPEIVINARKPQSFDAGLNLASGETLPPSKMRFVPITDLNESISYFIEDLETNVYNIFPVATITANGIFNTSDPSSIKNISASFEGSAEDRKNAIEDNLATFMKKATGEGLPEFGKLKFDFRTGFYVFEELAPEKVPGLNFNYKKLLLGDLSTAKSRKIIDEYVAAYKEPIPREQILKRSPMGPPKAFIFARPPSLQNIYDFLQLEVPDFAKQYLKYDQKVPTRPRWAGVFRGIHKGGSHLSKAQGQTLPVTKLRGGSYTLSKKKLTINNKTRKNKMPIMKIVLPTNPTPISSANIKAMKTFYEGISEATVKAVRKVKADNSR